MQIKSTKVAVLVRLSEAETFAVKAGTQFGERISRRVRTAANIFAARHDLRAVEIYSSCVGSYAGLMVECYRIGAIK